MEPQEREAQLELLLDLQHDLGKYLRMPVTFLPPRAGAAEIREALRQALFATRRHAGSVRSARELWEGFAAQSPASLKALPAYAQLAAVVRAALAWEGPARDPSIAIERPRLEADLGAVTVAIRALIDAVEHDSGATRAPRA